MGERRAAEGEWMDRALTLDDVRGEAARVVTPDGHGRLELARFDMPAAPPADDEERDGGVEVVDHDDGVVHPPDRHCRSTGTGRRPSGPG